MTATLSLREVYETLYAWEEQQKTANARIVELESQQQELRQELVRAKDTLAQGAGISRPGPTLQAVVEESLRIADTRVQEAGHEAERLKGTVDTLRGHIANLEAERDQAIRDLASVLELMPTAAKSLTAVVAQAVNLANESKRIIQENP